ncbi:hypothetical protein HPB47_003364 [Ixodes persulcatus]|uniref:Uncharacterized protein n=1 Tax=Ixodes persulcatus TaxID=34615 RepID=A0AC60PJ08_IXOPE|nr:hypothetical protein HPB47_003364 [Ixodes persulcatus]
MSYVLVVFLLDKTQSVVSSDYVRSFSGVVEDDKVYQVYWAGDARAKGGLYDSKVLYMAEQNYTLPMPAGVSRKAQTLDRPTATNALVLPALRNRIFQDDPQRGYCTARNTLATTQHVVWECPEHAAARFEALADIPAADQPNTFEDWAIPRDKSPPTVRLLWNQLCSFFYADGGPAGLSHRWPSVTANSLQ